MKKIIFMIFVLSGFFIYTNFMNSKNAGAVSQATSPVVLELFTSQSCSSCPPADRLLGELASSNSNIIALSCNVTYWDHLHWKDTLSKNFCTQRQRNYVHALQSRGPYTPQIVINGRDTMVGSQRGKISKSIVKNLEFDAIKKISLQERGSDIRIGLPQMSEGKYQISLIAHGKTHHQEIPSGENKGRHVSYTNPVEHIISLGPWNGKNRVFDYTVKNTPTAHGFVVLVQKENETGNIVAAGQVIMGTYRESITR